VEQAPPPEEEAPLRNFGLDVSVGYVAQAVLGEWPNPGVSGAAEARVDFLPVPKGAGGPRVGASLFGRSSVWPLQGHTDDDGVTTTFRYLQYGLHLAVRHDPAAPWSGTFGFGFSRLDLDGFEGGFLAVPQFTVEAGLRRRLGTAAFVELGAHGGWGSQRSTETTGWEDWWTAGLGLKLGTWVR
jgi:hypothetical protein